MILWFLATVAACLAVFALVYNVGQLTTEKQKVINAADAAALSGALVQARVLNFTAYTNRAMVANEVFLAQTISIASYVRYAHKVSQNVALVTSWIPVLGQIARIIERLAQTARQYSDLLPQAAVLYVKVYRLALTGAREMAHAGAFLAAQDAAERVAKENKTVLGGRTDVGAELVKEQGLDKLLLARNAAQWFSFTSEYGGDGRRYARQVIMDSRDQFSSFRDLDFLLRKVTTRWFGFEKTSGETVLQGYEHWEAQDTVDFYFWRRGKRFYMPIGWGRVNVSENGDSGSHWCYSRNEYRRNACATSFHLAYERDWHKDKPLNLSGWQGVPRLRDLKERDPKKPENQSVDFVVAVSKPTSGILTTESLGLANTEVAGPQGSPHLQARLLKDQLTALASAKVFFERPQWNAQDKTQGALPRADRIREYASLYNPYWQARLQETRLADKAAVYAVLGAPVSAALVSP
ncbi:MAG: pilus assembly protein TadG-related protein [Burkholderiaceae bacterium]|nr:pilus assembly protein TadG-related protein [Burkholderiaceae bacterium]